MAQCIIICHISEDGSEIIICFKQVLLNDFVSNILYIKNDNNNMQRVLKHIDLAL